MDLDYGNYPIVLSDALLGKATNEIYTEITYNHKAGSSSCSSSNPYHIKHSEEGSENYNLSYSENTENFTYEGERIAGQGQYILIFDPLKEHFVLHRIDSNFDMKLVSAPWLQNTPNQRSQHNQAEMKSVPSQKKNSKGPLKASNKKNEAPRRKVETIRKTVAAQRDSTPEEDSDDGLTIEYPDGHNPQKQRYNPVHVYQRHTSEEVSEDEDAAHEVEDAEIPPEDFKTPSHTPSATADLSDEDMEMALEAELEQELLKETVLDPPDESDESEEE
ncbi:hypothetical protein K3495_g12783 [Podosphaera aphanis]|nr:hypothetical protein K3495_g12783 [Podosphaera aphanis]